MIKETGIKKSGRIGSLMIISISLTILLGTALLSGCDQNPLEDGNGDGNSGGGSVTTRVLWREADGSQQNVVHRGIKPSDYPDSQQTISSYYSNLGSKVMSLTPENFKVPLVDVLLLSENGDQLIYNALNDSVEEEDIYANFTSGVSATASKVIEKGIYNGFFVVIDPMNSVVAGGGTEENPDWSFQEIHEIDVTIPGYTEVHFDMDTESEYPERTYLGGNTFRFSFYELHPDPLKTAGANYLFADSVEETTAVLGGHDGLEAEFPLKPLSNSGSSYPYFDTNVDVAFLSPFEIIDLTQASALDITVYLDIEGMIEVYDSGTPVDKSDDVVVFASNFWERFSLDFEITREE